MKRILFALLLASTPALAQEVPNPCSHGSSRMSIGGVDMDTVKCSQQVLAEDLATVTLALAQTNAQLRMEKSDHIADLKQLQDLNIWVHDYFPHPQAEAPKGVVAPSLGKALVAPGVYEDTK